MDTRIGIQGIGTLSAMENAEMYRQSDEHCLSYKHLRNSDLAVAELPETINLQIAELRRSNRKYASLDRSVLLSILASRIAVTQSGWQGEELGINIGSSRGATALFEGYYDSFMQGHEVSTLSSPTTSLGNLATWVANDLRVKGLAFSHSITCSTAMHAVLNGIAWLNSGMADKFLVGGAEAPLTDFTLAQMRALKIYSPNNDRYPCRALDLEKSRNTFVLGEGAGSMCLQQGLNEQSIAWIRAWGYSQEAIEHHTSMSENATCFHDSMLMASKACPLNEIDAIIMHAPGTVKGDQAEYQAIQNLFGNDQPFLTSNKWKIGHTLGASGLLSIDLALYMLQHNLAVGVPYLKQQNSPKELKNILVNAAGFGGNAVSIVISKTPSTE